jgi:hypothetical protein
MRVLITALFCLSIAACGSCSACSKEIPVETADAGSGVTPIQVGNAAKPDDPGEQLKPEVQGQITLRALGWAKKPKRSRPLKPADARARKALGQAMAGYRFAFTGDSRLLLQPLTPAPLPPHTIIRSELLGLQQSEIKFTVPDPGGQAAMATGRMMVGSIAVNPVHTQRCVSDALERIAKQARGSGQILPLSMSQPRLEDGMLLIDVVARVFHDGAP